MSLGRPARLHNLSSAQGKLAAFREQHPERSDRAYRIKDTEETT